MTYIVTAVLFSVLVSVLLKLFPRHRIDVAQAVTWNYLVASLLCWLLLTPDLGSLRSPAAPWPALLALAVILPGLFLILAAAVRRAGIVRTDVAQRLSLLLSLAAAFWWFGEQAGGQKLAGLALGLLAVLAILARPERATGDTRGTTGAAGILVLVWVGFALVDVLLKLIAQAEIPFAASLQVAFVLAFAGMLAGQLWRHGSGRRRLAWRNVMAGLLLGGFNFGNIVAYVRGHQALPDSPAVVFATMNIGVVVLGTLVGVLVFAERTSPSNRLGIVLAIIAIGLIAMAP